MRLPIYMDNHATTQVDPRVLEAMLPYLTDMFGNASSTSHPYGWRAREAVEKAREQVAQLVHAEAGEVIFTSGATESINLVLKGIARNKPRSQVKIITCVTEHSAVLDTCAYLKSLGADVELLPVSTEGFLDLDRLEIAVTRGADIVTLMHANNEIGTIFPILEIGRICHKHGVALHIDAAQSFGKIPIDFSAGLIDFLSISGHKLYAPKGVGCLLIKRNNPPLRLAPLIHGGGHERGIRSGTLNVPGIVALGQAAEICSQEMAEDSSQIMMFRDNLLRILQNGIEGMTVNGSMSERLPGNLNVSFANVDAQMLLPALRDIVSVSSGSACTSANPTPSHVLAALGRTDELAQASLRFGIGRFNTADEIEYAADGVVQVLQKLRSDRSGHSAKK